MLVGGAAEKEHAKKNEFEAKIGFRFGHLVLVTVGPRLLVLFGVSLEKKKTLRRRGRLQEMGRQLGGRRPDGAPLDGVVQEVLEARRRPRGAVQRHVADALEVVGAQQVQQLLELAAVGAPQAVPRHLQDKKNNNIKQRFSNVFHVKRKYRYRPAHFLNCSNCKAPKFV